MKRKKLVAVTAAAAVMAFGMTGAVYAAPTTKIIEVSYDSSLIPDPDHPGDAKWGVSLPSKIMFIDATNNVTGLDVTLKGMNGYEIPADLKVDVTVKSVNGFNVKFNQTPIPYTLTYDGTVLSGTGATPLTALTKDSPTRAGSAKLTSTATIEGSYSDTLIYTVQKATTPGA